MVEGLVNIPLTTDNFAPFILPRCFAARAAIEYFRYSSPIARTGTYAPKNFFESETSNLHAIS